VFIKNLLRRKIRTLLTILGISVGVAAIIGLGTLTEGMEAGYTSILTGSKADLVLSQPESFDISYSSVDETIGAELIVAPEVSEVSGMLQGFIQAENQPFFFVFGYPEDSFALGRFQIIDGVSLDNREAKLSHGKPILLGSAAAEIMDKSVGDTIRMTNSVFRLVGIYETGDAFEDSGALLELSNAQELLGKPRQVSLYLIRLKDPSLRQRFMQRVERLWDDLELSGVEEYADKQAMTDYLRGFVWAIGGLAIVLGGVSMMNAQLMSVMERTREIGVLRSVGWSSWRILRMILLEAISVSLAGGLLGVGLGWFLLSVLSKSSVILGVDPSYLNSGLLIQAFIVVLLLGLFGGLYPAWRASRLQPIEALRYEGGTSGSHARRLPAGGMAVQSLWQRSTRTLLTLGVIGLTVGTIMALEGVIAGFTISFNEMFMGSSTEIMIRQADISDTSLSAIDDRIADKIAAMPDVQNVSGQVFTAVMLPESGGFFVLQGYAPNELAIQRFRVVEGAMIGTNHQMMIGRLIADMMNKGVGDTIELGGSRFRIVGIFESKMDWEEMGGVISLRDSQTFIGRPRKSTMVAVKLHDPSKAEDVVSEINRRFPEVHASLAGDFVEQMPDMENSEGLLSGISFMAILVGGLGVLNTMLMSVFERTREIGVFRALGWRRRRVLGMILREALLLGLLGGFVGVGIAFGLIELMKITPMVGEMIAPLWNIDIFVRAISVALLLGLLGGLYPAFRATRLQPVEALRYE